MSATDMIKQKLANHFGRNDLMISTYLIGSLAAGEFNSGISDLDIFTVAQRPASGMEQRELLRHISSLWFDFKENVFSNYLAPDNVLRGDHEFYYRDEFSSYLHAYPARVWMPFHSGLWKHIAGPNVLPESPPAQELLRHDLFVSFNYFYNAFFNNRNKAYWLSKNLRRAVTKAIWLIEGSRPSRKEALLRCGSHLQSPSLEFLIKESEKITQLGYKYEEGSDLRRFMVEGCRLLNDLKQHYFNASEYDDEMIKKLELHQSLCVSIRNSRHQFSCTVHPDFHNHDAANQLHNILYQSFTEDLKLIADIHDNFGYRIDDEWSEYVDSHYHWVANPTPDLLDYFQSDFFIKREAAHQKLLTTLPSLA